MRKIASDLAASRKERPTTVHLLAAVASKKGGAADLLRDRGLDRDSLLKAGRSFDEEIADATARALAQAREVSKRARGHVSTDGADRSRPSISPDSRLMMVEPTSLHLLIALLSDRRLASFRALIQSGVDAVRLRTAALSLAHGVVLPRRETRPLERQLPAAEPAPRSERPSVVPLSPRLVPPRPPSTPPMPAPARDRARTARRPALPVRGPATKVKRAEVVEAAAVLSRPRGPSRSATSNAHAIDKSAAPFLATIASVPVGRPAVRREAEIERVLDVLAKHRGNSPCLVGAAGVGKSSLAAALAEPLAAENVTLLEIPASALIAGTAARGALCERVATIFEEARKHPRKLALFIDDLHELLGAGDEAVAELKLQLSRGDVALVTATSSECYRRMIESDAQLGRRFSAIELEEPDEEDAFFMVRAAAEALAPHHRVSYEDEALAAAVSWSIRYLPARALPDKAITVLDYAGARARRAAPQKSASTVVVGLSELAHALADLTSVPVERLLETDRDRMLALEGDLGARVIGHEAELARIAGQLRKSAAGLRGRRPLGSFLLLGPTGVGKTETAKALADALFGSSDAMTRLDLSEFAESHALARLIGAPPGYVGHEAGGQLTEAIRKRPYQVLLLDEIEKAHQDVLLTFLQVLDEGHLTDGRGRRVDFANVVLLCTSNLGSRDVAAAMKGSSVGFARSAGRPTGELADIARNAAKKQLPIELYNRFDEVLFFGPLSRSEIAKVAKLMVDELACALLARDVRLEADSDAIELLLSSGGYDPELGARPMRRAVARLIEGPIAEMLLRGELGPGSVALVGVENGAFVIDAVPVRRAG